MISHKNKFALALLLSLSAMTQAVFADCVIEKGPSKELSDYVTKLDATITKIRTETSKASCSTSTNGKQRATDSVNKGISEIVKNTNRALTQDDYVSASKFSTDLVLRSELPPGLRRDYNLLLRKQETLNAAIDSIYSQCADDLEVNPSIVDDPKYAEGVTGKVKLGDVAGDLLTNHIKVIGFYRESVVGTPPTKSGFFLVGTNFESKISEDYGPKGTEICNKKGDVFKKVSESIDRIGNMGGSISRWTDDWKAAWALLQSNSTEYSKVEKSVLSKELSRQGLSSKSSSLILRNLAHYNKTEEHRGISGFLQDIGDRVNQGFSAMSQAYEWLNRDLSQSRTTDEYLDRYNHIQALKTDIAREIYTDYQSLMDRIGSENLTTDEQMGRLADIYNEIDATAKLIEPYRKVAKDTCNQQTQNESGNCTGK